MTTTATQTPDIDIDALERDATARYLELEQDESRLALDALTDPDPALAQELADVRSQRASVKDAKRQFAQAREERERRGVEAKEQAEAEAKATALAAAEKLGRQLEGEAVDIDGAAAALAVIVAKYGSTFAKCQQELIGAGLVEWGRGQQPGGIGAAVRYALRKHDVLGLVDVKDTGADRPLAQGSEG